MAGPCGQDTEPRTPPSKSPKLSSDVSLIASVEEEYRLLGFDAVWILKEPTFRRKVSPPSSGFSY
jgi:hypothetical protein